MKKSDIRHYIDSITNLKHDAEKNIEVKDDLYKSIMIDWNQFILFCNTHLNYYDKRK